MDVQQQALRKIKPLATAVPPIAGKARCA